MVSCGLAQEAPRVMDARHRRSKPLMLRLGVAAVVPALIATGTYLAMQDDPPRIRTVTETPDGDSSLTTDDPTGPAVTPTPTASPAPDAPTVRPRETTSPEPGPSESTEPDWPGESSPPGETPDDPDDSPSDDPTGSPEPVPPPALTEDEADMWRQINDERANEGCPKLKLNSTLVGAARAHSADPDGASGSDRAAQAGYEGAVKENDVEGPRNAGTAMFLMSFDGVGQNLKNCDFDVVGVGLDDSDGAQWTVLFGDSD